jgi:hypothetical protein
MNIASKKKLVLLGIMSRHPVAGVIWQTIHYLVGFERLGYEVYYVEAHACMPTKFMESAEDDASRKAVDFLHNTLKRFGFENRWAFHALHADGCCYGMTESKLKDLYSSADLIINLHGATVPLPEHYATGRLVYLETDPVASQIELYHNVQQTTDFLEPHCAFFTFGENYGNADCKLPVSERFKFKPTRQPVVLDFWYPFTNGSNQTFTTVGNWQQQWRDVIYQGEVYRWSKHYEFEKFIDLPRHTAQTFELALSSFNDEIKLHLEDKGWKVVEAMSFSRDIDLYRDYIIRSHGEFTVAKDQNVRLRSGWFSDRSATYLAAGRPVITQETGFSNILPTGQGLFSFMTMEEIKSALEAINSNYKFHSETAFIISKEYFNYDVVLKKLLAEI